jgi:predicted acylesterase/phospholipase RssA
MHRPAIALLLTCAACGTPPARTPVPPDLIEQVEQPGLPRARAWADVPPPFLREWELRTTEELRETFGGVMDCEHAYLAVSGGGQKGAWGAGLLVGWTESGTRPQFAIVTGVSTGALIAPFAFLGPDYDDELERIYTSYSSADLAETRSLWAILRADSVADTAPLRERIAEYYTAELLEAIAVEWRKGRQLRVATTDLDTSRPVMWDMGRIAASDLPDKVELFGDILLASAAIPSAFPPVRFEVEAGGKRYEELHVDGGAASQVFLYPAGMDWRVITERLGVKGTPRVFVIRNDYQDPVYQFTEQALLQITVRSTDALFRTQGLGDLYRIYLSALRDGLEFKVTFLPTDSYRKTPEPFDREYMVELFERARKLAADGYPWSDAPPGFEIERIDG